MSQVCDQRRVKLRVLACPSVRLKVNYDERLAVLQLLYRFVLSLSSKMYYSYLLSMFVSTFMSIWKVFLH